jgi:hypothetical protein
MPATPMAGVRFGAGAGHRLYAMVREGAVPAPPHHEALVFMEKFKDASW